MRHYTQLAARLVPRCARRERSLRLRGNTWCAAIPSLVAGFALLLLLLASAVTQAANPMECEITVDYGGRDAGLACAVIHIVFTATERVDAFVFEQHVRTSPPMALFGEARTTTNLRFSEPLMSWAHTSALDSGDSCTLNYVVHIPPKSDVTLSIGGILLELRGGIQERHVVEEEILDVRYALGPEGGEGYFAPHPLADEGSAFFYDLPFAAEEAELRLYTPAGFLVAEYDLDVLATRFPAAGRFQPTARDGAPLANGAYVFALVVNSHVVDTGILLVRR